MRLLTWNSAVECHKSFLILIIAVLGALVGSCRGSSMDGVSLRFNKRGEREKFVNEFSIRTSAHEMWTYIKLISQQIEEKTAKKEIMKASSMLRIHENKLKNFGGAFQIGGEEGNVASVPSDESAWNMLKSAKWLPTDFPSWTKSRQGKLASSGNSPKKFSSTAADPFPDTFRANFSMDSNRVESSLA